MSKITDADCLLLRELLEKLEAEGKMDFAVELMMPFVESAPPCRP